MTNDMRNKAPAGVLTKLKVLLERNRLGELLVLKGVLTPKELKFALAEQKNSKAQLGRVLVEKNILSRSALYRILVQQWSLRGIAAMATILITLSMVGTKAAQASSIKDVPALISLVSQANPAFTPVRNYPALFGSQEKRSRNIAPFTKWSDMFKRFDAAIKQPHGKKIVQKWQNELASIEGQSLKQMAVDVNSLVNERPYILDNNNWGKSDYWETPIEFFSRGGDCEDFAIAKYASLRALGVPEERLRVAIVHDLQKDIPHAVLIVYTDSEALILDNQSDNVRPSRNVSRYRPIFTINQTAWWLHTQSNNTVVASAR